MDYNGNILKIFGKNYNVQRIWAKLKTDEKGATIITISGYNYSTKEAININYDINNNSITNN